MRRARPFHGRRVRGGRAAAASLTGAVLAVLTACGTPGPAPQQTAAPVEPPSTTAPTPEPPTGPVPSAAFRPCGPFQCAEILVPVDAANPAGPTIPLGIVRLPATDPARKVGTLLVNPGGPGGSGIEYASENEWPAELRARFDIVGWDPRGVGRSANLDCGVKSASLQDGDPDATDAADVAATAQAVDRYTAACRERNAALLPHLGTRDVARDMDRIRAALGEEKISYLGYSYGTSIGQTYARMYPDRLRTWVVDGVVDQAKSGPDSSADQARSFENALRGFVGWCAATPTCGLEPDPLAVINQIFTRLHQGPVPVPGSPETLSAGEFEVALGAPLYSTESWPGLAAALQRGDAGATRALLRLSTSYDRQVNLQLLDAVNCLDSTRADDRAAAVTEARETTATAPHFSGGVLTSNLTCAAWPTPAQPLDTDPPLAAPRPLVVGTTGDPATPYANSVTLARSLPGATLLTFRGGGHTAYLSDHGPCVDEPITRFLVEGVRPPGDVTC